MVLIIVSFHKLVNENWKCNLNSNISLIQSSDSWENLGEIKKILD